jgi:hypothetical protein
MHRELFGVFHFLQNHYITAHNCPKSQNSSIIFYTFLTATASISSMTSFGSLATSTQLLDG